MTNDKSILISGETGIAYARMAAIKGRLKLESVGLKFRGPSTRGMLAAEFSLKPRDSFEKYISNCEAEMARLLKLREDEVANEHAE